MNRLKDLSWLGHLLGLPVLFQTVPDPWLQERLDLSHRVLKLAGKLATRELLVIIGGQASALVIHDKNEVSSLCLAVPK